MRLLIVDDHPLFRTGLAVELTELGHEIVASVGRVDDALPVLIDYAVDVVLMDVQLPGTDGIEGTKAVVAASPSTRVVVLSTFDEPMVLEAAREAGAVAFVSKEASVAEVDRTIRLSAEGAGHLFQVPRVLPVITPRESQVLRELAQGRSNPEIALTLGVGTETVKSHVESLLGKFEARDRVALVRTLHRLGWDILHSSEDPPTGGGR